MHRTSLERTDWHHVQVVDSCLRTREVSLYFRGLVNYARGKDTGNSTEEEKNRVLQLVNKTKTQD